MGWVGSPSRCNWVSYWSIMLWGPNMGGKQANTRMRAKLGRQTWEWKWWFWLGCANTNRSISPWFSNCFEWNKKPQLAHEQASTIDGTGPDVAWYVTLSRNAGVSQFSSDLSPSTYWSIMRLLCCKKLSHNVMIGLLMILLLYKNPNLFWRQRFCTTMCGQ